MYRPVCAPTSTATRSGSTTSGITSSSISTHFLFFFRRRRCILFGVISHSIIEITDMRKFLVIGSIAFQLYNRCSQCNPAATGRAVNAGAASGENSCILT